MSNGKGTSVLPSPFASRFFLSLRKWGFKIQFEPKKKENLKSDFHAILGFFRWSLVKSIQEKDGADAKRSTNPG